MIGKTVSHYRITEKLGEGGMGVVFLAHDTSLDRQVALKFLPDAFASDPERLARFKREAKTLASLNHSSIAAIYGLEEADSKRFLVLELVEGETLAQRIAKGPLPVDEALEVCRQIAEGLEAAHEKGIIHRDLKPGNVKITPDGKVKVLDFGLAKAFHEEPAAANLTNSPTVTDQMTHPGVILGTAAYMSPEQAKGKVVDKRTDIWAFGCVLYECLTGQPAFLAETVSETIAAILTREPSWMMLPPAMPSGVVLLLRRCFQKNPRERLRDIGDARIEIGESDARDALLSKAEPAPRRFRLLWAGAGLALAFLAGILINQVSTCYFQSAPAASVTTSIIKVRQGHWLDGMRGPDGMQRPSRTALAISGDGRFVVYSAIEATPGPQAQPRLFLRRMDQPEARPIPGTEGGINPFLSPDGRWVGFWAGRKLKKIPIEGGVATELCNAPSIFGANWGGSDNIVFADGSDSGLLKIPADGGKPEPLTKPDPTKEEASHRLPFWLPNDKALIFTVMRHAWDSQPWICLLRLDTHEWRVLIQDAADARYIPTGYLVFLRQGTLMAVRFRLATLDVQGQPFPLVENVVHAFQLSNSYNTRGGQFSIANSGSLIYAVGEIAPDRKNTLVWVDQKGTEQIVTSLQFPFAQPRLSPDGQRIAYVAAGKEWQIWVYDIGRSTNSRLTGEGRAIRPIWSPDGKRILFAWQKSAVSNLYCQACDESTPIERLTTSEYSQWPGSWSSAAKTFAMVEDHPDTGYDISTFNILSGRVTPFLKSQFNELYPEFSPDGRWIAYSSDESKRAEVYVRPFPESSMKRLVSSEGGSQPLWSRDGKQIFYRLGDQMWVADVQTDGGFVTSKPRLLFEKHGYEISAPIRPYDLSLDGRRFLMVKLEERKPAPVTELVLVQNWFEELRRLVPVGK